MRARCNKREHSGTTLVFVVDTSTDPANKIFDGVPVGDRNGNGVENEVIDAQILAVETLVGSLNGRGLSNVNAFLVGYGQTSTIEFRGTVGADDDGNGVADIIDAAQTLEAGEGNDPSFLGFTLGRFIAQVVPEGLGDRIYLSDGSLGGEDFLDAAADGGGRALAFGPDPDLATLDSIDGVAGTVETVIDPAASTETVEDVPAPSVFVRKVVVGTTAGGLVEVPLDDIDATPTGFAFDLAVPLDPGAADAVTVRVLLDQFDPRGTPLILETTQVIEQGDDCVEAVLGAPSETVEFDGGRLVVLNFDTNETGRERTSDTLLFSFGEREVSINTVKDLLDFVTIIEKDGSSATDALYNADGDLALVFARDADGGVADGILLADVIGRDGLTTDRLAAAFADNVDAFPDKEMNMFCRFNHAEDLGLA